MKASPIFEIYKLIAEAMGYGDFFQFTADEYLNVVLSTPMGRKKGITIDKIREKNYLRCDNDPAIAFRGRRFWNRHGTRHVLPRGAAARLQYGPGIGFGEREVVRVLGAGSRGRSLNPIREKFPFTICCEHMRPRSYSVVRRGLSEGVRGRASLPINPEDAAELGIEEGTPFASTMIAVRSPCWLFLIPVRAAVHCPRSFLTRDIDGDQRPSTTTTRLAETSPISTALAIEKL